MSIPGATYNLPGMGENQPYDLVIIGAGPAGSTLARLLGRDCPDLRLLLLEKRALTTDDRQKCCGGLLAPDAAKILKRMKLTPPASLFQSRQPLKVRALDLKSGRSCSYPRPYGNLDRLALERWLVSLLPPQVEFRPGCACLGFGRRGEGWEIKVSNNETLRCRLLVSAEGAGSRLRRYLESQSGGQARRRDRALYLAVQDSFPEEWRSSEHTAFFHPGLTDFYGWVVPKQGETLLGLAMPLAASRRGGKTPGQVMAEARALLARQGYHFAAEPARRACLLLRPCADDLYLGAGGIDGLGGGALCIGEAAGWISPSSAEGFSYAFASARALAGAIRQEYQKGLKADNILAGYRRGTRLLRLNIAWKGLKARVMYSPFLRALIMASGVGAE
ncbi:MAG: hypothetical protein LBM64_00785 [Deltaproteobacteria bacterium]|nr:hypothetical protein [Deltaproteobacteria bacterium]